MATTIRSYAKINLGLGIGPVRADGFHELLTVYQTIGVHDLVTVTARRLPMGALYSRLSLTSNNPRVPQDARNTAWRMVAGAVERMGLTAEVHVHIEKRLPIQGGIGAGSANAAAALIGLERELGQRLEEDERLALAAEIGSDVPLFLVGGTVIGTGRGEVVEAVRDLPAMTCVIAIPEIGVSTPRAFQAWDALQEGLTSEGKGDNFKQLGRSYASLRLKDAGNDWPGPEIVNDFETVVFKQHPSLFEIKKMLMGGCDAERAVYAALSGSGSALFGLYATSAAAEMARDRLQKADLRSLLTETLPRRTYWARMIVETPDWP